MKGFTILEIILSLVIMTFITMTLFLLTINLGNFNTYFTFGLGSYRDAQLTLTEIKKELASAQNSNLGGYFLEEATSTKITFYSDIDQDGLIEKISYFVENNQLKKSIITPTGNPLIYDPNQAKTRIVVNNLASTQDIFSYFDKNYATTSDISKIRLVKVDLKVKTDFRGNFFENYIIVAPRNVKDK